MRHRKTATDAHLSRGPLTWLGRGLHVAAVFWRFGFGASFPRLGLSRFIPRRHAREVDPASASLALPVRLRLACEELGPVTIKLGQALASRPDLLPADYVEEFRHLQDDVPPFDFATAQKLVEAELGAPLTERFSEFDAEVAAAASMAQIHFAVLPDGHRVAVKVQRPEVEQTVETDLQILQFVADRAERHVQAFRDFRVARWVEEFAHNLRQELSFTTEGHNTDRLREALADDEGVRVPRVYWSHSTRKVLVIDRIDGAHIADFPGLDKLGVSRARVARRLAQSILRQILIIGFFHADPHPGNLMVQPGGRVVFLDCGHAVSISRDMREALGRLLLAVLDEDAVDVCDEIIGMGAAGETTDLRQLRIDVERVIGRYSGVSTSDISVGEILEQIMGVVFHHRVVMPTVFVSMLRAMILTEGTCRQLDPKFDFHEASADVAREVVKEWVRPRHILREMWRAVRDLHRFGVLLPRQISELIAKTQSGGLKLKIESAMVEEQLHRIDIMCNRLAFALVVAAIIVGSSIMIASGRSISLLSLHGAYGLVGAVMGVYLLISIIRSRGL